MAVAALTVMPLVLRTEPLSAAEFAPYGIVIQAPRAPGVAINGGSSERFELVDDLRLHAEGGRPVLALFRAQPQSFPRTLLALERHALGTQSFLPLGDHRFVVVVAPAGPTPRADNLRAFLTAERQGVVLAPGTCITRCWRSRAATS